MIGRLAATVIITFVFTLSISAQTAAQPSVEGLQKRVADLELQLKAISAELTELRSSGSPASDAKPEEVTAKNQPAAKTETAPAKTKDLGIDVGSARITPYGTIFFNAFGNSGGTNNADVPILATPTGNGNVSASVRQTRLGLKLEGLKVGNAKLGGVIEGDFFGGFPSVSTGENFGVFRVRLAFVRLDWEKTSVTAGQDWMVFAPVNPVSLAATGNPQLAAAGNNWARLPQARVDHKFGDHVTWQGALLEPQTGDFATNAAFVVQPTSGAASRVPFVQSRIAFSEKNWFGTKKRGTIGVSGHFGRSRIFTGASNVRNNITSDGIALDWNFPISERVSISGESFAGRNLGGFQAGVFQSYNNDFAYHVGSSMIGGGVRSIGTRGGWTQIGFTPQVLHDRLGVYGSIGIDDPDDKDLVSLSHRDWRTRNLAFAADVIYKFTPQFSVGAEFRRFQTNYFYSSRQNANHINLGAAYTF